jgi:ubiquinone/menaquinone biosynthesis C-methylase UbiE
MFNFIYSRLHRFFSKPQERGEYSSGVWQDKIRSETLKLCLAGGWQVLEVGCGEGLFLGQLAQATPRFKLWGVDNSPQRIEQARKRLAGKVSGLSVGDATKLSFGNESFDAVVCINVFFNMPSLDIVRKTLIQMKRVAKKQGRLIFDFRNSANPLLALKYKLAPLYDHTVKDLPLKTYNLKEIADLLKELKLEIVSLKYPGSSSKAWAPIILVEAKRND